MQTFTLSSIQAMLGLSRSVISSLIAAGFVTPTRGKRREYRFSFQDVVLLRTAYSLQSANIPPRKILRSLQRLKDSLPEELPLSGLRIAAVGNDIAVREGDRSRMQNRHLLVKERRAKCHSEGQHRCMEQRNWRARRAAFWRLACCSQR